MKNKLFSLLSCLNDFNIGKTGENRLVFAEKAPEAAPKSEDKGKPDVKGAEAVAADAKKEGAKEVAEADPIKKVWPEDLAKVAKSGATAPEGEVSVNVKTRLNFRDERGTVVKGLNNGDKLKVDGNKVYEIAGRPFIKVTSGGRTGYVALKYTSAEKGTTEAVATAPVASPPAAKSVEAAKSTPAEDKTIAKSAPARVEYGKYIPPKLKQIPVPKPKEEPKAVERVAAEKVDDAQPEEVLVIKRNITVDKVPLKEGTSVVVVKRKPDGGKKATSYDIKTPDGAIHAVDVVNLRIVKAPKKGEINDVKKFRDAKHESDQEKFRQEVNIDRVAMRTWQAKVLNDMEITKDGSKINIPAGAIITIYDGTDEYQITYGGKRYDLPKDSIDLGPDNAVDTRFDEAKHYGILVGDSEIMGIGSRTGTREKVSSAKENMLVAVLGVSKEGYKVVTQSGREGYVTKNKINKNYIVEKNAGESYDAIEKRLNAMAEAPAEEKTP